MSTTIGASAGSGSSYEPEKGHHLPLGIANRYPMILTYRYRLLPSRRQHRALESILESQRLLYNAALEERMDAYRKAGITRTLIDQQKALTVWRREDAEATSLPVSLQRGTLKRLDDAYRAYFRRVEARQKPGFSRFKGRGWFNSFGFQAFQAIALENGRLRFKGMPGSLRVHLHRPAPAVAAIKSCIFRRDPKGWTVGFAAETAASDLRQGNLAVGIDLGISTFAALSDGGVIPSLRAARVAQRRLRIAQRSFARKRRSSRGRKKARIVVSRCYQVTRQQRSNHLHQASAKLVKDYDTVAVEQLEVAGLCASRVAKDARDAAWGTFISLLKYKAEKAGVRLIEVDARFTTQDCSECGTRVPKDLRDRTHKCPLCGLFIDRDLNAARNILNRAGVGPGLRNVAGCGTRAGGNLCEPSPPQFFGVIESRDTPYA